MFRGSKETKKSKDYSFLGIIYFTSNDGSQNIFVCPPILDMLELKNVLIMFLVENQREFLI